MGIFAALAAMGCGTSTANSESSPSPSPSPSATPLSEAQQFNLYVNELAKVAVAQTSANRLTDKAHKAFDPNDQSTWAAYQKAVGKLARAQTNVEARVAVITPPKDLQKTHALLQKVLRLNYEWAIFMQEHLRLKDAYSTWWKQWGARSQQLREVNHRWQVAMKAEALRSNAKIPKIVMKAFDAN